MDWKIIAALVVAVAIVVSGFVSSGGLNLNLAPGSANPNPSAGTNPLGDFLAGAKDAVSNLLTGIAPPKNANRTLDVSGSLALEDGAALNAPAGSIALEFSGPASMDAGSERIVLSDGAKISLANFTGKMGVYPNSTVNIDGNAETISAGGAGISSGRQKTVPVRLSASVKSIKIYNASADSLGFNVSGTVKLGQGKTQLSLGKDLLQIENFLGDLNITGASISITGLSTKVLVNRNGITVG